MIPVLDDALIQRIATHEAAEWLILEPHPDFDGQWVVQCLDPAFFYDFKDEIGSYRAVSPAGLDRFLEKAKALDYKVAFGEDPASILDEYDHLNDEPVIELISSLPGTTRGMLPYQIQGYNFLKDLNGGVAMWSTGTGKTVLASALLKYHIHRTDFDIAWVVVRAHNKINTQRTLKGLAEIDSVVLDGPQKRRNETLTGLMEAPSGSVVVTNYEKFRVDHDNLKPLFDRRILIIWDEMPTKLKTRDTQLYRRVRSLLYKKIDLSIKRPQSLRQYMLSATPIENNPEDWFNCVRLLNPEVYGSIKTFRDEYVQSYSPFGNAPAMWKNLDKMGLKAATVTHQVDKESPDIASQFPKVIETPYYIDWHPEDRKIYDLLAEEAKKTLEEREDFTEDPVLSLIGVMQMMCDAPSMVSNSAAVREAYEQTYKDWLEYHPSYRPPPKIGGSKVALRLQEIVKDRLTDANHTKLDTLRQILLEDHPDEKIILFTSFNHAIMPILEGHLHKWQVPFMRYGGSTAQKQMAQDYFQKEDFCRLFLTSDMGSDSLSLEQASVVIHYDLPWKWSTFIQRQNRAHRITSTFDTVRYYTLMMANSVEERKWKIVQKKAGYHNNVFKGVNEQSESSRMTREDLMYILGY